MTPVLILVSEGLVDAFCDGLAVQDEAFGDGRLGIKKRPSVRQSKMLYICIYQHYNIAHIFRISCNTTRSAHLMDLSVRKHAIKQFFPSSCLP